MIELINNYQTVGANLEVLFLQLTDHQLVAKILINLILGYFIDKNFYLSRSLSITKKKPLLVKNTCFASFIKAK
jgi:hypothetical protein